MVKGLSGIPMKSVFELPTTKHLRDHELKLTKHMSKLEVRRHFLYGTTSQQMEQFGSSNSECKYREPFQEWSAVTETISDGFLRGLKSD